MSKSRNTTAAAPTTIAPAGRIEHSILMIRGERAILDADMASLYGVQTKVLNQAVKRNADRFPKDFMFRLTKQEKQEVVTNCDHLVRLKFSSVLPYAFTEHGALMAASALNSPQAVQVSVYVIRAFIRLRRMLAGHKELASKLADLEQKVENHDQQIVAVVKAIRQLMAPPPEPSRKIIGFRSGRKS